MGAGFHQRKCIFEIVGMKFEVDLGMVGRYWLYGLRLIGLMLLPGFLEAQQVLIDDFESGTLANWNVIEGNADIQNAVLGNGTNCVWLYDRVDDGALTILHSTFRGAFGRYSMRCSADGENSDIQFIFQYIDQDNHYRFTSNPTNTDNPEFRIWRVVNGQYTQIDSIGPIADLGVWHSMEVDRRCDGYIGVTINGTMVWEGNDQGIMAEGTIGLGGWAASTYFDDVYFEEILDPEPTPVEVHVCSGEAYLLGNRMLTDEGIYYDTLTATNGCDSVLAVDLIHEPHYLVRDTICADSVLLINGEYISSNGVYNKSLSSQYGCDSLVTSLVYFTDTMQLDTFLCEGSQIEYEGETIEMPGSYHFEVEYVPGCVGTIALEVAASEAAEVFEEDTIIHCFQEDPILLLEALGFDSVKWSVNTGLGAALSVIAGGVYELRAYKSGCVLSDTVVVDPVCAPSKTIFIPNAFTPDGNQINDSFRIHLPDDEIPSSFLMTIYDRWGGVLFSTDDFMMGWDGTYNSTPADVGTYIYTIKFDEELMSGEVVLLR